MTRSVSYAVLSTALALLCLEVNVHGNREESDPVPGTRVHEAEITFIGDMMVHMPQIDKARQGRKYDFSESFRYVRELFSSSDLTIANLETSISQSGPYAGYPTFRSPDEFLHAAVKAGIGMVTMANNHCLDNGTKGVVETIGIVDSMHVARTGVFIGESDRRRNHPIRLNLNGITFSLFNYTYGTNGIPERDSILVNRLDTALIAADLDLPDSSDFRIALLHWGVEYATRHSRRQEEIRDFFHRHNVPIIIGSHPHVVQEIESDSTTMTAYSLGNFVSNQRDLHTDGGVVVRIGFTISDTCRHFSHTVIPVWVRKADYAVIPYDMADTIPLTSAEREASRTFFSNTRARLSLN